LTLRLLLKLPNDIEIFFKRFLSDSDFEVKKEKEVKIHLKMKAPNYDFLFFKKFINFILSIISYNLYSLLKLVVQFYCK